MGLDTILNDARRQKISGDPARELRRLKVRIALILLPPVGTYGVGGAGEEFFVIVEPHDLGQRKPPSVIGLRFSKRFQKPFCGK